MMIGCAPMFSTDGGCDFWEDHFPNLEPSAGETVYLVDVSRKEIAKEKVYAVGVETFLVKEVNQGKPYYTEYRLEDHGKVWFFMVELAKRHLERYLTDDEEIAEDKDGWYAARL